MWFRLNIKHKGNMKFSSSVLMKAGEFKYLNLPIPSTSFQSKLSRMLKKFTFLLSDPFNLDTPTAEELYLESNIVPGK